MHGGGRQSGLPYHSKSAHFMLLGARFHRILAYRKTVWGVPRKLRTLKRLCIILLLLSLVHRAPHLVLAFSFKDRCYVASSFSSPTFQSSGQLALFPGVENPQSIGRSTATCRRKLWRAVNRISSGRGGEGLPEVVEENFHEGQKRRPSVTDPRTAKGLDCAAKSFHCSLEKHPSGPQHVATLTDSPSRAEIKSFFSFLAAFVSPPAPLRQLKQQQQHLPYQQQPPAGPSLSEALDGVMFLAACAVSHQWGLSIEPASKWLQGSCQGDASAGGLERPPKQQQRRRDDWLLLCGTPSSPCSAETVSVRALTWFFNSLRQFVPRLPQAAVTQLIAPLFVIGREIRLARSSSKPSQEVQVLAQALLDLLQEVLQRAAAEAPSLPSGETVQRVSTVYNLLSEWSKNFPSTQTERFKPLLLLGGNGDAIGNFLEEDFESHRGGIPNGTAATALAVALQRSGALMLPRGILEAMATMVEASAVAAARGLKVCAPLLEAHGGVDSPRLFPLKDWSHKVYSQQQQPLHQRLNMQQPNIGKKSPPSQTTAYEVRLLVAALASWLPVYYLLMRLGGGIWLPAVQQLAEVAAAQGARLIELFISEQQAQRGSAANDEKRCSTWAAVGRMLYGEVQQLSIALARLHSLRPLKGTGQFAAAAVSFDRFLAHQACASAKTGPASPAARLTPLAFFRPLLHTHEPPRDIREAERRIRFFCSLVTLGATDRSLTSGVAACLPSESQLDSLLSTEWQTQEEAFSTSTAAAAVICAQRLPLKVLQRLLFACSWIGEWTLVTQGLKVLRYRLDTLTLQRLLRSHSSARNESNGVSSVQTGSFATAASASAETQDRSAAELVGKTLSLLQRSSSMRGSPPKGDGKQPRPLSPDSDLEASELQNSLCSLASAATLWAAVSGFEGHQPEDVALLTFSLIPFWIQQTSARASPVHTEQNVQTIRSAAAGTAAVDSQEPQTNQQRQQGPVERGLTVSSLVSSLNGSNAFASSSGISSGRCVAPAAVEFYLSELCEKRGPDLSAWPSPILFLLAYNMLRLRQGTGIDTVRATSDSAAAEAAAPAVGPAVGAIFTTEQQQHQLSSGAEAAASQLLLHVVDAIDKSVSFPDSVNAWCRQRLSAPAEQFHHDSTTTTASSLETTAATKATTATIPRARNRNRIRLAGMREVGSFLWALSRVEGGFGAPVAIGANEAARLAAEVNESAESATRKFPLWGAHQNRKNLTLQEASHIAAQIIRRPGGFADKLAVYAEATLRAANDHLLQREGPRASGSCASDDGESRTQSVARATSAESTLAARRQALPPDYRPQAVLSIVKSFCLEAPNIARPPISLPPSEKPSLNWLATAGVSLGLLLSFYSSCKAITRHYILSGILHAPLLTAECGLLQLFHLLRPLAASARAAMEDSEQVTKENVENVGVKGFDTSPTLSNNFKLSKLPPAEAGHQYAGQSNSNSSILRLLRGAPTFLFAAAAALLRHSQIIEGLPVDSPKTAAQVQLLLLATSDFAALLHAHCHSSDGFSEGLMDQSTPAAHIPLMTASREFRHVVQELLSIFSEIVVRHGEQICDSLPLLAAAAEVLSRCGRQVSLPPGSKKAVESFASAAIAALRQPASYDGSTRESCSDTAAQGQTWGGTEGLKRLAIALEALKFVELK